MINDYNDNNDYNWWSWWLIRDLLLLMCFREKYPLEIIDLIYNQLFKYLFLFSILIVYIIDNKTREWVVADLNLS